MPHVKLSPMSAPGPTGERQEHLDAIVSFAGAGQRRCLFRGLDVLTIKWAFARNTQLMFLKKEKDPTTMQVDDDEWIRSLTEVARVTLTSAEDAKKVRPIQMGEFLRKFVSLRLLALSEGEIAALTTSMRQIGVCTPGGAEALAIFRSSAMNV